MPGELLGRVSSALEDADLARCHGRVSNVIGLIVEATGVQAEIGELCLVHAERTAEPVAAEVVGFRDGRTLLMALGELNGIGPGTKVLPTGAPLRVPVGPALLGHVLDGLGAPLDEHTPPPPRAGLRSTIAAAPGSLQRPLIEQRVALGVRALDSLIPCGRGQRLGIFAGSGVGKSSLLGTIARSTSATVNVIALVGERGREVREFVERDLGEGLERSVVVVATSDQPALVRIKAAFTATTIAEYFRDQGNDVLLLMDSLTRFATAQRELGLAIGEPPATRGYTPSVFAMLPRLLERAGTNAVGSITGLYTVLVDGDDMNEPIADAARSILDGHVVLSRALAHSGHYPAIDVLQSVSRLLGAIATPDVVAAGQDLRAALAALQEKQDLIAIGAYRPGAEPLLDAALAHRAQIDAFLRQALDEQASPAESDARLLELAAALREAQDERSGEVLDGEFVAAAATPAAAAMPLAQPDATAIPLLGPSI